jgi:hypothetical protein
LKQFRPLVPDALPLHKRKGAFSSYRVLGIWLAGAAAVIILIMIGLRVRHGQPERPRDPQSVAVNAPMPTLTMRDANSKLARAPSYKAALDEMAFHRQYPTVPRDKQSAVAVLAKEKIKL